MLLRGKVKLDHRLTGDRIHIVLKEATDRNKVQLVSEICNNYDPSMLIHEYILEKNVAAIKMLSTSRHLNWHSTLHGKSLIESAYDTRDDEIISVLLSVKETPNRLYPNLYDVK